MKVTRLAQYSTPHGAGNHSADQTLSGVAPPTRPAPPSADLQQLWFSILRYNWSSLVIVPSHPQGSAKAVAQGLADIGVMHSPGAIRLINAEGLGLQETQLLLQNITEQVSSGFKVLVTIDSVMKNMAGLALAQGLDAVLMAVWLQSADFSSARRSLELIGRQKVIGCVAMHREKKR